MNALPAAPWWITYKPSFRICLLISVVVCRYVLPSDVNKTHGGWKRMMVPWADGGGCMSLVCYGGARLGLGMIVLSVAVALRYVGGVSVMRCPSTPLQSNPIDSYISLALCRVSSLDAFLDALLGPANANHPPSARSLHHEEQQGEYNRPSVIMIIIQMAIHAFCGSLFTEICIIPLLPSMLPNNNNNSFLTSTTLQWSNAPLLPLMFLTSVMSDNNHQLNRCLVLNAMPRKRRSRLNQVKSGIVFVGDWMKRIRRNGGDIHVVGGSLLCHVAVGLVGTSMKESENLIIKKEEESGVKMMSWFVLKVMTAALVSIGLSILAASYVVMVDGLVRWTLLTPGVDVDRLILSNVPDSDSFHEDDDEDDDIYGAVANGMSSPFVAEDLIIQSVISGMTPGHESPGLTHILKSVVAPRHNNRSASAAGLEQEELVRSRQLRTIVADVILSSNQPPSPSPPPALLDILSFLQGHSRLEMDVLRISILEALGGGPSDPAHDNATQQHQQQIQHGGLPKFLPLTAYHHDKIRSRLSSPPFGTIQPLAVPVVRVLCAYVGGMAQALFRSTSSKQQSSSSSSIDMPTTWTLPPSAPLTLQYAILAAMRLILLNFYLLHNNQRQRHTWISFLLPTVLESAHALHQGILHHTRHLIITTSSSIAATPLIIQPPSSPDDFLLNIPKEEKDHLRKFVALQCPDLRGALVACDHVGISILSALMDLDGRDMELKYVGKECRDWLNSLTL